MLGRASLLPAMVLITKWVEDELMDSEKSFSLEREALDDLAPGMMRVAVITSDVPFVDGGHRIIAEALTKALVSSGHLAEIIRTPQNRFGQQFSAYLATWLTDVGETGDGFPVDRVISLRYPSYAVRHPYHICWLNHRMREYYDLWPRFKKELSWKGSLKESARRKMLHSLDLYLLKRNVKRLFVQSKTIGARLRQWGGIDAEVLYPPPPERPYRTDSYENFVFSVSRLHLLKRVDLLVKAMKHVKSQELRAVIAGTGEEEQRLRLLAQELGVANRIDFVGRIDEGGLLCAIYGGLRFCDARSVSIKEARTNVPRQWWPS